MLTPVLLTIAGTDPSGGAGLQVSAFSPTFSTEKSIGSGRFESVYSPRMLRDERVYSTGCSEYNRCTRYCPYQR